MAADKEQLTQDLAELKKAAKVAYKFDKREAATDGRPFDIAEWLLGGNIDKKYPGGPAFKPYLYKPTLFNMTLGISFRDMATTLFGAAIFYGLGHQYVAKLGIPTLSGNRLGAVLTIPIFVIGYTSGLKRAYQRHLGYIDNGEESLYPNYKRDDYTPYIVKHKVSDRHLV